MINNLQNQIEEIILYLTYLIKLGINRRIIIYTSINKNISRCLKKKTTYIGYFSFLFALKKFNVIENINM